MSDVELEEAEIIERLAQLAKHLIILLKQYTDIEEYEKELESISGENDEKLAN